MILPRSGHLCNGDLSPTIRNRSVPTFSQLWRDLPDHATAAGAMIGRTRERIRQIEAKALRKLRHPSRSLKLKSFLEYRHE